MPAALPAALPCFSCARQQLSIPPSRRRDSTKGFHGPQHPTRVFDILDDFRIGTLVEETHKDK